MSLQGSQSAIEENLRTTSSPRLSSSLVGQKLFISAKTSCSSTRLNVDRYERFILDHGAELVSNPADANILLLDSCGARSVNEDMTMRQLTEQKSKVSDTCKVIVSGCLATINPDLLKSVPGVEVFSPRDEEGLAEILGVNGGETLKTRVDIDPQGQFMGYEWYHPDFKTRVTYRTANLLHRINNKLGLEWIPYLSPFLYASQGVNPGCYALTISEGCMSKCAFCATHLAKGRTRSVPLGIIIDKVKEIEAVGVRDLYLSSEDTGAYGVDVNWNFPELLERIHAVAPEMRIYVNFYDPRWVKSQGDQMIDVLKKGYVRHLYIGLQSGSDRILNLMRRGCKISDVKPFLLRIRAEAPQVALTTAIIPGFPGETEEDFQLTRKLVRDVPFDRVEVSAFALRPGTEAELLTDHIPQHEIDRRASILDGDWKFGLIKGLVSGKRARV